MPTLPQIEKQIHAIVGCLLETGLIDDQQSTFRRHKAGGMVEVTFEGADHVSIALRDRAYETIYQHLLETRAYNVRMFDGALIQMMYTYSKGMLQRHRLAYFPSPHLEEFQNDPDVYLSDVVYADIIPKSIVPFPSTF